MWFVVFYWKEENGLEYLARNFFDDFLDAVSFADEVDGSVESTHNPGFVMYRADDETMKIEDMILVEEE